MFTGLSWIDGIGGRLDSFSCLSFPAREDIFRKKIATCLNSDSSQMRPGSPISFPPDHPHATLLSVLSPFSPAVSFSRFSPSFQFPGKPFSIWRHRSAPLDGQLLQDPSGSTCHYVLAQNLAQRPPRASHRAWSFPLPFIFQLGQQQGTTMPLVVLD